MSEDPLRELCDLLVLTGARVTFSIHCRSGLVGDMCRCWRCRGEEHPADDESAAARDAELIDRAGTNTVRLVSTEPFKVTIE